MLILLTTTLFLSSYLINYLATYSTDKVEAQTLTDIASFIRVTTPVLYLLSVLY